MRTSALILISGLLLAVPAGASAQTFAGGSIGTAPSSNAPGTSELGFRINGSRITVRGAAVIACRRGRTSEVEGTGSGPLNPDGTFRVTFTRRRLQPGSNARVTRTVAVSGQVRNGNEVVGKVDAKASGGGLKGCSGVFDFVARTAPTLGPEPAPVPAGATLLGMTSQTKGGPFALNLRVSGDGRRVQRLIAGARYTCRKIKPYQETNYSPAFPINADGTFRYVERFKIRYTDAVERVTVTTAGRFVNGGATGTWKARSVARSRKTGRVVDRCGTGERTWSAALL